MKKRGFTAVFLAAAIALALAGTTPAAPPEQSRAGGLRKEYLFEHSNFFRGENIFFARDAAGGPLETSGGRRYDRGAYIGALALAPGNFPRVVRVTGEKFGALSYKRNIHARYRRFEAVIAPSYAWRGVRSRDFVGTLQIICDGIEVFSRDVKRHDAPLNISVDLTGVKKLEIMARGRGLCLFDPFLVR